MIAGVTDKYEQLSIFEMLDSPLQAGDKVYFTTCNEVMSGKLKSTADKHYNMCVIVVGKDIWHVKPECVYRTKADASRHIREKGYTGKIVFK